MVYLASHKLIGREAAVKVLRPEFCDANMVSRFFDDAKMTTSIKHPGIVDIYDFGYSETGRPYIVMERLQGDTLTQRIHHVGQLSPQVALAIVRQIASTLAAAHDRGVIHRGLKPDNIFLIRDVNATGMDRVKVLDFGVAKLQATDAHLFKTATGMVLGEPSYMAPEQCIGSPTIDGRADLYALGCILFHMICGRPPFVGAGIAQVLAAHVNMAPPPPTSIVPETPPEVERMILNLLDKSPHRRPQRAHELVIEIDAILPRLPRGAAGPPPMPPPGKRVDHSRTMMAGGAVPAPAAALGVHSAAPAPRHGPPAMPGQVPPPQRPPGYSNGNGHASGSPLPSGASSPELGPYGYPVPASAPGPQPGPPPPAPLQHGPPPAAPPLESSGGVYDGGLRRRNHGSTVADAGARRAGRVGLFIVFLALAAGGIAAYFIATSTDVAASGTGSSKSSGKSTAKTAAAKPKADPTASATAKASATKSADADADADKAAKPDEATAAKAPAADDTTKVAAKPTENAQTPNAAEVESSSPPPPPTAAAPAAAAPGGSVVMVFVTLDTEPSGAQVFLQDKQVGTTPYRAEVASAGGTGAYVLKLAGFKDAPVSVPRDRSFADTVKLERGTGTAAKVDAAKVDAVKVDPATPATAKVAPAPAAAAPAKANDATAASPATPAVKPRKRTKRSRRSRVDDEDLFDEGTRDRSDTSSRPGGKRRPRREMLDL